ncbi:MAG: hypothetical protein ACLTSZ_03290 [Lachnospiraceae bacterium]
MRLNEYCTKQQMLDMQAIIDEAGLNCRVWRYENTQTSTAKGASLVSIIQTIRMKCIWPDTTEKRHK